MARRFDTSVTVPYRGAIASAPVAFCDGAQIATIEVPWRSYGIDLGTNVRTLINPGVRINVARPPATPLTTIQGVYIDNTACDSPVYLVADDTNVQLTCADGTSAFFPVLTNGTEFTLYIESVATPYDKSQFTRVVFCDKPFPPYSDEQFNEFVPVSQVSGTAAYSRNVQGDQYAASTEAYSVATSGTFEDSEQLIAGVSGTTLVITNVQISCNNLKAGMERQAVIFLQHNGQMIFRQRFFARPYNVPGQTGNFVPSQNHPLNLSGIAVRLNGLYPIRAVYRMLPPAGTEAPNAIFVPDVHIVYARIQNPTL